MMGRETGVRGEAAPWTGAEPMRNFPRAILLAAARHAEA
jgi:hypothetical protein